ncbi:hypothetical protein Brsp04_04653 [Brucella sp. NBRC 12952]
MAILILSLSTFLQVSANFVCFDTWAMYGPGFSKLPTGPASYSADTSSSGGIV